MAKTRLFLDTRKESKSGLSTLKIALAHQKKTAYIILDVKLAPNQWDSTNSLVVNHPEKERLNLIIADRKVMVDRTILILSDQGKIATMDAKELKKEIEIALYPEIAEKRQKQEEKQRDKNLFANRFLAFAESKKKSTKSIYMHTYSRMDAFVGHAAPCTCL